MACRPWDRSSPRCAESATHCVRRAEWFPSADRWAAPDRTPHRRVRTEVGKECSLRPLEGSARRLVMVVVAASLIMLATMSTAFAQQPTYREQFRPQFHFTPAKNWM